MFGLFAQSHWKENYHSDWKCEHWNSDHCDGRSVLIIRPQMDGWVGTGYDTDNAVQHHLRTDFGSSGLAVHP